jgi:hypothetical protein
MKKLLLLFVAFGMNAQIHRQDEDRFSIQITTDNVIFQKGIFYGGIEFQAEFSNGIYIRPQIHYADLPDGYLEISAGIGLNLTYEKTTEYDWKMIQYMLNHLNGTNLNLGVKLGNITRDGTNGIFGFEAGLDFPLTEKIRFGFRGSYDARGDADFYDGEKWVYNSQAFIKFIL